MNPGLSALLVAHELERYRLERVRSASPSTKASERPLRARVLLALGIAREARTGAR
jgi:hypothetical protein